ncbi:hypothetical protein [Actinoplanes sp. L3-i22]|uniref:hypothetical protein n=1 Tax=Actinoplanes sp. L3-i22 TaxID=2836373 RepID=UPI001C8446C0|nr:hypothetical protein [Actinoplanes sp. L3-i22]
MTPADVRSQLADIRRVVAALPMSPHVKAAGRHDLDIAESALNEDIPDEPRIALAVHSLTQTLVRAGAITRAGRALHDPLTVLGAWLGPQGLPITRMLD